MLRRMLAIGGALLVALLLSPDAAKAERLGGAYRGPYSDNVQSTQEETSSEVGDSSANNNGKGGAPDTGGKSSGSTGGDSSATTGGTADGSGGSGESGSGENGSGENGSGDGGESPPPAAGAGGNDSSGGNGSTPPAGTGGNQPSAPTAGEGLGTTGGNSFSGRGKTAKEEVEAFWPFWFEHNKEWILGELLRERASRARLPELSSPALFMIGADTEEAVTPVSEEMKRDQIYPVLVESLTHSSSWVRDSAVLALGKLGSADAVTHLAARLKDPDEDVREDALLALGLTGRREAMNPLMTTLLGNDMNLKGFAALGLGLLNLKNEGTIVPKMLAEYKSLYTSRKTEAQEAAACIAIALGMIGDESCVGDLAVPLRAHKVELLKIYICQALGRIGGDAAQGWLVREFNDRDKGVVGAAVLALSNFPDQKIISLLMGKGLKSGDRMAKLYAVVALGRIGKTLSPEDGAFKTMSRELKEIATTPQKDKYTAMYAALALAIMGDDAANDFFADYLSEDNRTKYSQETHSAMAMALGLLEYRPAARDLLEIVTRGRVEDDYRGYAAFALGIMGDRKAKSTILKTMEDEKRRRDLVRSGCWAVGLLGDRTDVPKLIEILLRDEKGMQQVRGAAAIGIGLIGDSSAVQPLLKIAREDPQTSNRAFAIAALGCLIDKDPVPRIPQLFMNIHFRKEFPAVQQALLNL